MSLNKQILLDALIRSEQLFGLLETLDLFCGKNFCVCISFSSADCKTSIDELQLSVRSQNALMRAGLFTVDRVIDALNQNELIRVRSLGMKSLKEIKTRILLLGFESLSEQQRQRFFEDLIEHNPGME